MTIYMNEREWMDNEVKVGDKRILVERRNVNTGDHQYQLREDNGGIPGNMDATVKRYHGWRGTTCNVSVIAYGLREVTKIQEYQNGSVRIWLGEDLKPDAE